MLYFFHAQKIAAALQTVYVRALAAGCGQNVAARAFAVHDVSHRKRHTGRVQRQFKGIFGRQFRLHRRAHHNAQCKPDGLYAAQRAGHGRAASRQL